MEKHRTRGAPRHDERRLVMLVLYIVACASAIFAVALIFSMHAPEPFSGGTTVIAEEHRVLSAIQPHSRYTQVGRAVKAMSAIAIVALTLLSFFGAVLSLCGFFSYRIVAGRSELAIRRAVGATQSDLRRHILLEGHVVIVVGLAAGAVLARLGARWLANKYPMAPLPETYVAGAVLVSWVLGVLIGLIFAREAARITPAL